MRPIVHLRTWIVAAALIGTSACVFVGEDDPDFGRVSLTWSIEDAFTGEVLGCAPGDSVETTIDGAIDIFDCFDFSGVTGLIPAGDYLGTFQLVDDAGFVVSETSFGVAVFDDTTTDVGEIVFLVE